MGREGRASTAEAEPRWEPSVWMRAEMFKSRGKPSRPHRRFPPRPLPAYRCINHTGQVEGILPAQRVSAEIKESCKPRDISNATFD